MPDRFGLGTIIVILVIVAVVAIALGWLRKRRQPYSASTDGVGRSQTESPAEPASTSPTTATAEPPATTVRFVPGAEREFGDAAARFEGLYESLYRACVAAPDPNRCRSVLGSWERRLDESGAEALQQTWREVLADTNGLTEFGNAETADDEKVVALGRRWLELLRDWGMERDERPAFELEEDDEPRYFLDGEPEVGRRVEVEVPCWMYKGGVIERGVAWIAETTE